MRDIKDIDTLIFGEGLLLPTLTGEKKITIRKYREGAHDFKEDQVILGVFREKNVEYALLQITADTENKPFNRLTDKEARADGYEDAEDAFNRLKNSYYPDLKKSDTAAIIRYELLRFEGHPIILSQLAERFLADLIRVRDKNK